jgi:hypothetical protein
MLKPQNQALADLRRDLFALSELAREASSLCDSNSLMPSLPPSRLEHQVLMLGMIEDRMLAVADAITAFERAAAVQVTPTAPPAKPVSEARQKRFAATASRKAKAG